MTGWGVAALIAAGGIGGVCRLVLGAVVPPLGPAKWPLATTVINVLGSFLLGLVTGLAAAQFLPGAWKAILATGFLGGFTTFSTASNDTARLVRGRHPGGAAVNAFGMFALAVGAAALGVELGG